MSQINVNRIKDSNEGAPDFPSGVNVGGITSTVTLGVTNLNPTNLNVSGVVTATTLDGNLLATGTPTLGLGVTINTSGVNISGVATAGIVSATTLYGDGSNLTGIALTIAPLNYNPAVGGLAVGSGTGIGITFNQGVKAGSGNVTLSIANAGVAGTVVENFGVGNSVTYSNGDTITITPTSSLDAKQTYHLSYPSGAFTNIGGDVSYVGTAYTFITVGGQTWMWGMNNKGQLGLNNTTQYSSPVQIPGNGWSSKMSCSDDGTSCVIKTNGELWAWGDNNNGALGQNNKTQYSSPVQIPGTTWAHASASQGDPGASIIAVKTDGTMWVWGNNENVNGLGLNNNTEYSSPVQLGSDTTWVRGEGGKSVRYGLKTDGTLWVWGSNTYAGLGLNQALTTKVSSPVQIPGTNWAAVSSGNYATIATKTDGTLWSWGSNGPGALGLNNRTNYSSPVQVPGTTWPTTRNKLTNYSGNFAGAIKTDGTLWTWGRDNWGNLGHGSSGTYQSSPTQVPGTTWKSVAQSGWDTLATKTDGTLWGFGTQGYGQLGVNNRTQYNSPVQALGGDWNIVAHIRQSGSSMAHKEV
jgi:alpha-tubulin suppressor-like RCC1 family protein